MCTALLVPFTTLCATFLAVYAVLFATFFAVLTGPASTVPMEMAKARMIEKNAFMVLNYSLLIARVRLSDCHRFPETRQKGQSTVVFESFPNLGPPGFEPGTKGL